MNGVIILFLAVGAVVAVTVVLAVVIGTVAVAARLALRHPVVGFSVGVLAGLALLGVYLASIGV